MNNRKVCEYVSTLDCQKNNMGEEYISDLCVQEGYGQSYGGYLEPYEKKDLTSAKPSQKEHFLNYYSKNGEKLPTYSRIRCPQLLLFIAEIAGLSREKLLKSYEILKVYEDNNCLKNERKDGNYMLGKPAFADFKLQLRISDIVDIIKCSQEWDEVIDSVRKL